ETVLRINVKSAYFDPKAGISAVDLNVNQEQFHRENTDLYLHVQVLEKQKIARILGYAWYCEVDEAESNGQVKSGEYGDYIHLKAKHTIDEMVTLFNRRTGAEIELDDASRRTKIRELIQN